jgi:hypothetical protein
MGNELVDCMGKMIGAIHRDPNHGLIELGDVGEESVALIERTLKNEHYGTIRMVDGDSVKIEYANKYAIPISVKESGAQNA